MTAVPSDIPVTTPLPDTLATPGDPLLHVPPVIEFVSVTVVPVHTIAPEGVIAEGLAPTVMVFVTEHPDEFV